MTNKCGEIGLYVEDIPMKLSEKCKPIDFSAYVEEETHIPDIVCPEYKFSAELFALEVAELRNKERVKHMSQSMGKISLNTKVECKSRDGSQSSEMSNRRVLSSVRESDKDRVTSIHLNPGEILKPLPTKGTTIISDNHNNISDNCTDSKTDVNLKRKLVKQYNPKDFESDTSSPFDFVELQTIDDMQELNDVFQAFNCNSKPYERNSTHGSSHSLNYSKTD